MKIARNPRASPLFYLRPARRSDLYTPTKKWTWVCPIPLTVAITTQVLFFPPVSLSILHLIDQLRTISVTNRTQGPLLSFSQPQTSQYRIQNIALATHYNFILILAATGHLGFSFNRESAYFPERLE